MDLGFGIMFQQNDKKCAEVAKIAKSPKIATHFVTYGRKIEKVLVFTYIRVKAKLTVVSFF